MGLHSTFSKPYLLLISEADLFILSRDRATYDPSLSVAVNYSVASPADAPDSLTYGPSFFTLANQLPGDVTIGLNRELNDISNTEMAAVEAKSTVSKLLAIELGNEPECEYRTECVARFLLTLTLNSLFYKFTNSSGQWGTMDSAY